MAEGLDRVFVDTNELFPFTVMDLVLALAEHRLIEFVWTDELLAEWERVIVREGQRDPASARSIVEALGSSLQSRASTPARTAQVRGRSYPTMTIGYTARPL